MTAYYNEKDPKAAAWLRELIKAGAIAPGDVDERSIVDVRASDVRGYTQCHWFAGVGVWSYSLRRAGVRDDQRVWTASLPCQPFSAAGKQLGFEDERHLWPFFEQLVAQSDVPVCFGEQVASKAVDEWIDVVLAQMEALDFTVGSLAFSSAICGAPHIRDRTYWVAAKAGALADAASRRVSGGIWLGGTARWPEGKVGGYGAVGELADTGRAGVRTEGSGAAAGTPSSAAGEAGEQRFWADVRTSGAATSGLADANNAGLEGRLGVLERAIEFAARESGLVNSAPAGSPTNGFWADPDWLLCRDGKWRPVESGTSPLANGAPGRVGRLRGYGNAVNAEAARIWIETSLEAAEEV
jgi:DNA (cytosine-5)-methyltransferase 1